MLLDFLQVNAYMFGSVPLRTYLPDGDIDLSVFCAQDVAQPIRDTWAMRLQGVIEQEQSSGTGPYKIGDITVINAEVSNRPLSTPCWTCKQLLPEQQGIQSQCAHTDVPATACRHKENVPRCCSMANAAVASLH